MGTNLSQIIPHHDQARRLGNPDEPLYYNPDIQTSDAIYHGITTLATFFGPTSYDTPDGTGIFGYQIDFARFDTGRIFIVHFKRNHCERLCLENHILNHPESFLTPIDFHYGCFPDILNYRPSSYITAVDFRTEGGIRLFEPVNSMSIDDLPYNTIPEELRQIPRVQISELVAPPEFFSHELDLAVVRYDDNLYVFKNHSICPLPESISWDDRVLKELLHIYSFQSTSILSPSYIVTGTGKSVSKFRGFLRPYCPAGSLFDVIRRLRKGEEREKARATNAETPKSIRSSTMGCRSTNPSTPTSFASESLVITWAVKHQWTIDITSALATLHKSGSYVGALGLCNLLLGRDGHIKLIDISPFTGFSLYTAAPEVNDGLNLALTGPRDVFSLGLIFWQLAEEMLYFGRETTRHIPRLSWNNGQNRVPEWFRVLVQNCLHEDPAQRPSTNVILSTLIAYAKFPSV